MNYEKQINIQQKANEIIKLFIDNKIPLYQQLEILKLARKKIEFCRKTGAEIKQKTLDL
jgi:hypothetical protein